MFPVIGLVQVPQTISAEEMQTVRLYLPIAHAEHATHALPVVIPVPVE